MSLTPILANLLIIMVWNLYNVSNILACDYKPPWERESTHQIFKEMYKRAEYEEEHNEPGASIALMVFRKVAEEDFEGWWVDSKDNWDGVVLDRNTAKKEKSLNKNEEKCFPEYYDKNNMMAKIQSSIQHNNFGMAEKTCTEMAEVYPHYSGCFTLIATAKAKYGNKEGSIRYLKLAKETNPKNPFVFGALAVHYQAQNDTKQARDFKKQAEDMHFEDKFDEMIYFENIFGVRYADIDP
jgi:predicted Zn-dependent protease